MSVAVLAEALVVRCANLGASVPAPARRRTAFCPPTVDTFAWPMDLYDLTSRSVETPLTTLLERQGMFLREQEMILLRCRTFLVPLARKVLLSTRRKH